jgi:two-component system, NarL family, response regulator DesR
VSIRTFVAEPAALTREGLLAILGRVGDIEVIAAIRRGEEVVTAVRSTVPDVLLLAARFPGCDGIALVSGVLSAVPECRCAVLSSGWRAGDLRRAAEAGVRGFLAADSPADCHAEFLTAAIRKLAAGGKVVDPSLPDVARSPASFPLTTRESDVLHVAAQGATTAEIARVLCLSEGTVRNYLSRAITKTGARNRVDAIRIASESGWLLPRWISTRWISTRWISTP